MANYSEMLEKLKEIDWEPIAEKAMDVLKSQTSEDLTEIPKEDRDLYEQKIMELSKLTMLHITATDKEKTIIETEMGMVKISMQSMEARNALFSYRQTLEVIGIVLAITIRTAIAVM